MLKKWRLQTLLEIIVLSRTNITKARLTRVYVEK
jgi:hypothetical protein